MKYERDCSVQSHASEINIQMIVVTQLANEYSKFCTTAHQINYARDCSVQSHAHEINYACDCSVQSHAPKNKY